MNERWKRILFIVLFFIAIGAIAFGLYWVFFRAPVIPSGPTVSDGQITGQLPSSGSSTGGVFTTTGTGILPPTVTIPTLPPTTPITDRVTVLSTRPSTSISAQPSGNGVRLYDSKEGKFYRIGDDGTASLLSDKAFFNIEEIEWGHRTDQAILAYPDGSKIYYDFATARQVTLPRHWEDFQFSPSDDQVILKSVGNNPTNRFLVIANPDGTNAKAIEDLGENQDLVHTSWSPNDQIVAYAFTSGEPLGYDRQAVVMLGKNEENFKNLIVEGRGIVPNWSPTGNNILYSVYSSDNGYRPTLWVSGAVGDNMNANRRSLGIQTWADKCVWQSEAAMICAVPSSLQEGAGLQRAVADNIPDRLYKIDLATGQAIDLGAPSSQQVTIKQMTISPDGRSVYYTDQGGAVSKFSL